MSDPEIRRYSVTLSADVVRRDTVEVTVSVEAKDAAGAMRSAWKRRTDLIAPVVPEGFDVTTYRAESDGNAR